MRSRRTAPDGRSPLRSASLIENFWALGFWLAGRLFRPNAAEWTSSGGQRVWAVAPHPDDEAIGCGGALIRHAQAGDQVCIVCVTDGRRSRALGLSPDLMAVRREAETRASARALGVSRVEWLGLPEGEWVEEQLHARLESLYEQFPPHLIYAPSRIDFHPEHGRTARGLAAFLRAAIFTDPPPHIRIYPVQVPLTPLLANLVVPVARVKAELAAALNAYVTQSDNLARAMRQRRYAARLYRRPGLVEEFWEMTAKQYVHLHSGTVETWATGAFRGLRHRAFTDPLAYLRGWPERKRLARVFRSF